jgi:hypothetical protein
MLQVNVASVTTQASWPADSSTYAQYPYRWSVVLEVTPQTHSSPLTRKQYVYDGDDIVIDDWLSNTLGGFAWQIKTITSQSSTSVTCIVEDVNQYNTYADPNSTGDGAPPPLVNGFVFIESPEGFPILFPMVSNVLIPQWQTDILSRFLNDGIL